MKTSHCTLNWCRPHCNLRRGVVVWKEYEAPRGDAFPESMVRPSIIIHKVSGVCLVEEGKRG